MRFKQHRIAAGCAALALATACSALASPISINDLPISDAGTDETSSPVPI